MSRSVICKWFLTRHAFKGGLGALNQVPIDKFSPDNCLCLMEYVSIITQIDPMLGGPAHLFLSKYVFEQESFFLLLFLRREEPRNPCARSQFLATEFPPSPHPRIFWNQPQSCLWRICMSAIITPRQIALNVV